MPIAARSGPGPARSRQLARGPLFAGVSTPATPPTKGASEPPWIPLPPLDGSAAVLLGLSEGTAHRYQQFLMSSHALGMIGLLVAWQVFDLLYDPIFTVALNLLYPGASYG